MKQIEIDFDELPAYIGKTSTFDKFGVTRVRRDFKAPDAQAVRHFISEYIRGHVISELTITVSGKLPAWLWLHIGDELKEAGSLIWTSSGAVADIVIW